MSKTIFKPSPSGIYVTPEVALKQRSDIHLARKIWHACGVSTMVFIYFACGRDRSFYILGVLTFIDLCVEILRRRSPKVNAAVLKTLGWVMRKNEVGALSGTTYLFLGGLVLLFFPYHIVILSLLFLAFADPIASYVGIRHGKDRIMGHKTLQGSMAAFVVCCLIAGAYFYKNNIMIERIFIVAPLAGIIGAVSELIPIAKLDDNFSFPVNCAVLLSALFYLFGGFAN